MDYLLSAFSSNAGKYGPERLRIWTFFMQWLFHNCNQKSILLYLSWSYNNIIWIVTQNLHKLHYRQVVLISKFLTARIVFNYQAVFLTINILVTFWMLLCEFLMVDWKFWAPMRNILLKTEFWLVIYVNYIQAAVKTLKTLEAAIGDVL